MDKYEQFVNEIKKDKYYECVFDENTAVIIDNLHQGIDIDYLTEITKLYKGSNRITRRAIGKKIQYLNSKYLILLCDENELTDDDIKLINHLKSNECVIFIFLILPNEILLPEHDVSGIPDIRKIIKEYVGFPAAVTVEKNLLLNFKKYVNFLFEYIDLLEIIKKIKVQNQEQNSIIESLLRGYDGNEYDDWLCINLSWQIESLEQMYTAGNIYNNRGLQLVNAVEDQFHKLADECVKEFVKKKFKKESVGDFAADLLCKYGKVQNLLHEELIGFEKDSKEVADSLYDSVLDVCRAELVRKSKVAFVGTFSSGKTSFINWLLDMEGEQQLRTSGGHNTAILTYIKSASSNDEHVSTSYKCGQELFEWTLFSMSDDEGMADVYTLESNVIVKGIDETNRIIYFKKGDKEFSIALKNKYDDIIVKKNQRISTNIYLTKGYKSENEIPLERRNVMLRPLEEYKVLKSTIQKKKILSSSISVSCVENTRNGAMIIQKINAENDILRFLKRLIDLYERNGSKNIRYKDIPPKFWNADYLPKNIIFSKVIIQATCNIKDANEKLNNQTWKKYCGTGTDEEIVFSEKPEGYLFTKSITYSLKKGFLDYSDIIDTPGLGSLSDEHDAITESYIRGTTDNLLVMIKVDKNAQGMSKRKFIGEIADIFDKSGRNKKNVFFVCNLWSSQVINSEQSMSLKKYCDQYFELVSMHEFDTQKFYVIDIKKMQMGRYEKEIFNYPSDVVFRDVFLNHISNSGIDTSLTTINRDVSNLFKNRIKEYTNLINEHNYEMVKRNEVLENCRKVKKKILSQQLEEFEKMYYFENDSLEQIEALSSEIRSATTYKEWKTVLSSLVGSSNSNSGDLDSMEQMLYFVDGDGKEVVDGIVDNYLVTSNRIIHFWRELFNDDDSVVKKYIVNIQRIGMSKFPFEMLKKMLVSQENSFCGKIHFIKNSRTSKQGAEDISNFIDAQLIICRQENITKYKMIIEKFEELKKLLISEIENKERGLVNQNNAEYEKSYMRKITIMRNNQEKWNRKIIPEIRKVGVEIE